MYCECEKDACVPEKYYKNGVCTVSTKKMPCVPQKMSSGWARLQQKMP